MKNQFVFRQIAVIFLTAVILLNGVGFQVFATDSQILTLEETVSNFDNPLIFPETEVSGDGMSFFGNMPEISEEREVEWIDRIHNKPQYAIDFYNWLVDNSCKNGALVTGEYEYVVDERGVWQKVYTVEVLSGQKEFVFPLGSSIDNIQALAMAAVEDEIEENYYTVSEWVSEVFSAFDRDHPEVFWLSGAMAFSQKATLGYSWYQNSNTGTVFYNQQIYFVLQNEQFDIRSLIYPSDDAINRAIDERNVKVDEIIDFCQDIDDVEKIKFLNDYLTKNNCYNQYVDTNYLSPMAHKCLSALLSKTSYYAPVCDGYSKAFKVLCDKIGIPCVLVDGVSDDTPHMWNYVNVNDTWYAVDVTWNDPTTSSSEFVSGQENEKYLLVGSKSVIDGREFSDSHIVHNTVLDGGISFINEPLISKTSYNASLEHSCIIINGGCSICASAQYDVNRDASLNILDFVYLKQSMLNDNLNGNLDCDGNGKINSVDFVDLRKHFWSLF